MDACDVLIVGGGPAGSSCAWALRGSGLDVVVVDRAAFPRDKVCAGWLTPPVLDQLELDRGEYGRARTLQPFARFRLGFADDPDTIDVGYDRPVSFGIRRREFDDYLLRRSGARLRLGEPVSIVRREADRWVVNDVITAPLLVGAAGHWCPVARRLNDPPSGAPLVAAQEFEVPLDAAQERACAVAADRPELYFSRDLGGYGWAVRKGRFLNVGFGRLHSHALPAAATAFLDFLKSTQRVPADLASEWRGHAYLIDEPPHRRILDDGILLVGDAAGLAYPRSGEGIRPAVESGLAAAAAIVAAAGVYTRDRLTPYEQRLHRGDGLGPIMRLLGGAASPRVMAALASYLIGTPWFARHVLLDRWFLHRQGPFAPQR